jgi:hypothetical protein
VLLFKLSQGAHLAAASIAAATCCPNTMSCRGRGSRRRQPLMKLSKAEMERRLINSTRDNCINWRGAAIRTGDNVLLNFDGGSSMLVGQLIDIKDENAVPQDEVTRSLCSKNTGRMALVRWYHFVDEKEARRPPVGNRCHLPYSMQEVCLTTTAEWVSVCHVANICFVFHLESIQKGFVSCGGMERVYFIRFHKNGPDLLPLKERDYKPFYRDPKFPFQEGYPEAIWSQLACMKMQLAKEMSCGGAWDGRTKSAKLNGIPPSFFGYLKEQFAAEMTSSTLQYNKIRTARPKKHVFDNFASQQVRMSTLVHQIRFLEESELDIVRKICGNSFGVGLTTPVPSIKDVKRLSLPMNGTVWLRDDHEVRIVSCLPNEEDLDYKKGKRCLEDADFASHCSRPSKLRCSFRGVDICHVQSRSGVWELVVQARFVKVRGSSLAVRKAQGMFLNNDVPSDVESEDIEVSVGEYIRIGVPPNLNTYVVVSIDNNGIVCCADASDENTAPIYMPLKKANFLYNKYIRY